MRGPCRPVYYRGGLGMSALHTPGPWEWAEDVDGWGREGLSPDVIRPTVNERIRVDDANARLIAAAPDLLDALKIAMDYMSFHNGEYDCQDQLDLINAAIAKATGETK